jgi:hypothetical protein
MATRPGKTDVPQCRRGWAYPAQGDELIQVCAWESISVGRYSQNSEYVRESAYVLELLLLQSVCNEPISKLSQSP